MKRILKYLPIAALALGALGITGCQDDFDKENVNTPVATLQPNMTIMELKQKYWNDATNYIDTIKENTVIHGWVVSSDEAGNVFKSLVIQDETAALALSINSYNLYLKYRVGQEIVLDLKDMYIGKYNGLVQLGMPEWYEAGSAWEATFMAPEFFEQHAQPNGWPDPAKVDTLEINSFSDLPTNPDGLCRYQSRIVKFNNVEFQNGGTQQFSEYHSSGVNQNIVDAKGNTLPVRTSGYSNFWNNYLPKGRGDVVAILSYYGTTGWQLLLNDYAGCMNFGNPTVVVTPGDEDNPYTVEQAVDAIKAGQLATGWVKGYIVGAVAPEVTDVKSDSDIEWGADVVLANTLVIGATPDTRSIANSLVISLPSGSAFRQYGNLVDNPGNYKKEIMVKGTLGTYMGTYGVLDNTGKKSEFSIEGVTVDDGSAAAGNGTEDKPYNVDQVIAKNPTGNADAPDETGVWVTGYIVGWADMSSTFYINAETATFSVPATMNTNILLAATPDEKDWSRCIGIQLPAGAVRTALNLKDNPGNLGRGVELYGNIAKYSGVPGLRSTSQYKWLTDAPDTPTPDEPTPDDPTPDTPVVTGNAADFNTLNNGTANTMSYNTYTTAQGWTADWSLVLAGGADATNFISTDASFLFPCLDGTVARTGKLTSPTISGGLGTLSFNFGFPFNDSKVQFTVNILQNGSVVATDTVLTDPATKAKVFNYSHDFNITGNFVIQIVNDCVTKTESGNKDRVAIWDLTWTGK